MERGAVCHAEDGYLTAARLRDVYRVDDACGGVEVETEVLEGSPVIAHFLARKFHGVEHVLVLVEVEHVVHVNIPFLNLRVVGQGSRQ